MTVHGNEYHEYGLHPPLRKRTLTRLNQHHIALAQNIKEQLYNAFENNIKRPNRTFHSAIETPREHITTQPLMSDEHTSPYTKAFDTPSSKCSKSDPI